MLLPQGLGDVYEEQYVKSVVGNTSEDKDEKVRNEARMIFQVRTSVCLCVCTCVCVLVCTCVYLCVIVCVRVRVCVYVSISVYLSVCLC